jgi:diacylglycerol kinase family enzyme
MDRDDPVAALDAYGAAREATIDMGEVNGEPFVNNVSLGIYAHIVSSSEYREAKRRTVIEMLPELLGPDAAPSSFITDGPDGPIAGAQLIEVSNNPYTLCSAVGFGSRPWLDSGALGVAALTITRTADVDRLVALEIAGHPERFPGWRQWTVGRLEVRGPVTLAAAIDGEARTLEPPLEFAIRPRSLRVRIAKGQSGASPALRVAPLHVSTLVGLFRIARGWPSGIVLRSGTGAT